MIDIIIPIYNSGNTLEKTLMSLKLQTLIDKINIYLIDDNSIENYDELLNKYKDMNINYLKLDKNVGPGQARQKGLEISNGEYILFIDSDDLFYDSDSIKNLYEEIIKGYDYVIGITYEEKRQIEIYNSSDLHGKIYRRKFLEDNSISFNKTRIHEDNYFNNLVLLCNPKEYELLEKVYIYVDNKDSITNTSMSNEFKNYEIMISNIKELLEEAKKRNCDKEKIIAFILNKINYFNRIFLSFTDTEKNVFIEWIKQYNLKIENYINNDNSIQICEELYNNYQY